MDDNHLLAAQISQFYRLTSELLGIASLDGYFMHLNPSFSRVLGYSLPELYEKSYFEFVHPDDVEATRSNIQKLATLGSIQGFENRYICKDGSICWLSWNASIHAGLIYFVAHDITQRKADEARTQALERIYQSLVQNFPNSASLVFDQNLHYVLGKGPVLTDVGFDADIAGKAIQAVNCPLPHEEFMECCRLALNGKKSRLEHSIQHRIYDFQFLPVQEQHYGMLVILDVSEERQIQRQLELTLEQTALLYDFSRAILVPDHIPDVLQTAADTLALILGINRVLIIEIDVENRRVPNFIRSVKGNEQVPIFDFDELWEGLTGWVMRENKVAISPKDSVDSRESPHVQARRTLLNTGSLIVVPIRTTQKIFGTLTVVRNPDEPDFTTEDASLMMAMAGQLGLTLENIRVLDLMREKEKQFRQFIEQANDIVLQIDPEGIIRYINPIAEYITGYFAEEVVGKYFSEFVHPDARDSVQAFYIEQFRTRTETSYTEFPVLTKQNELKWLGQNVRLLFGANQRILGMQAIARDITERRQIEIEREELIYELDAFAHTVAHDLKTPLSLILGYSEMGILDLEDADTPLKTYMNAIWRASHQMERIIDEILNLALLRRGQTIDTTPMNMAETLHNSIARVRYMLEQTQGEISLPDTLPSASGYAPWVEEIWTNYLSNAIKYGGRPPRIEISATPLSDGMIRYEVRDNGEGLTPEQQSRLFHEFARLEPQKKITGHGLGLSIVKRIAERLNGQVGVESEFSVGSVFWFSLPASPSEDI